MPIETLAGTKEDMINLCNLIEHYFEDRKEEKYIPKHFRCAVSFKLWPIKQFRISMKAGKEVVGVTAPFIPDIKLFGSTIETLIKDMVEDLENKEEKAEIQKN